MSEISEMVKEKLFQYGKNQWLILLLMGILLLVIALPVSKESEKIQEESQELYLEEDTKTLEKTRVEENLSDLLSNVEGVGKVKVMVMTEEGEKDSFYANETETVSGVLIAAQGADDFVVVRNIQEAVMALFQVDAHKIKVMKMK